MRSLYTTSILFIILCTASNLYSPSNSPNLLAEEKHQETHHPPPFYFPPSQTCPLTINALELISSFNTFSALFDQLQGIHFYKDDTSFLAVNSYVQLTSCSACTTERIIQLTEQNGDTLTQPPKLSLKWMEVQGKSPLKSKRTVSKKPSMELQELLHHSTPTLSTPHRYPDSHPPKIVITANAPPPSQLYRLTCTKNQHNFPNKLISLKQIGQS